MRELELYDVYLKQRLTEIDVIITQLVQRDAFSTGAAQLPDTVWHKLQPGVCIVSAVADPDPDILCGLSETDPQRCGKRCSKIKFWCI